MSYQELLVKLMDGIVGADIRSTIAESFQYILNAYLSGMIDDDQLKKDLVEFCIEVLVVKKPFEDLDKLREEAEEEAEKLFKAVKAYALRYRLLLRYGRGV